MTFKKNFESFQAGDQNQFTIEKNHGEPSENENGSANSTIRIK
jgi:hypothetical protein